MIQKSFQYVGWFDRPLSSAIYISILILLFVFYFLILKSIKKKVIIESEFWKIVLPVSFLLIFSYNAFSYDIFNYIFDARIVTLHHENPYLHKALDYPNDPWINFMRWTHRVYPYGPVWLGLTVPLSIVGFQFFLPTLFLFKALAVSSFLGTVYFIGKIVEKFAPDKKILSMAFFALNPLVIIEALVSGHHDIVMIFFAVFAIHQLLDKKYFWAFLLLLISVGIKFATLFLLPIFIGVTILQFNKKKIDLSSVFTLTSLFMIVAVIFATLRTELQPWYLIWVLPFLSFILDNRWLVIPLVSLSLGLLLGYVPFLFTGNWDPPIPTIKIWLTIISIFCGLALVFVKMNKNEKI